MDTSSAESGADAGEPKPAETENLAASSSENSASQTGASSENPEVNKVLSYGPAQRDVEVPEIKAQVPEGSAAPEIRAEKAATDDLAAKKETLPGSALIPFVGKAKESAGEQAPKEASTPRFEFIRSRGMQAAVLAAFGGIAWAFAGSIFSDHAAPVAPQQMAALSSGAEVHRQAPTVADNGETRHLTEEIRALKKELDGLRSSVAQNATPEEIRTLKKNVDALKNGLESTKSEIGSSLTQLSAKLDKAQHDPTKLREISDRLDHIERSAPLTTASITPPQETIAKPAAVPLPPIKAQASSQPSQTAASTKPALTQTSVPASTTSSEKPQPIPNWVVRDVYDGIALVEGPRGSVEVIEGETIPGVGTVKSIERRGSGWIVLTSRGMVDSARN